MPGFRETAFGPLIKALRFRAALGSLFPSMRPVVYVVDTSVLIAVLRGIIRSSIREGKPFGDEYIRMFDRDAAAFYLVPEHVMSEIEEVFATFGDVRRELGRELGEDAVNSWFATSFRACLESLLSNTSRRFRRFYVVRLTGGEAEMMRRLADEILCILRVRCPRSGSQPRNGEELRSPTYIALEDAPIAAFALAVKMLAPGAAVAVLTWNPRDFRGLLQFGVKLFCRVPERRVGRRIAPLG